MSSTGTRVLGWAAATGLALTAIMALVYSPADAVQGDAVRLLYLHVPTAWLAMYLSFGVTTLASLLYLWKRTRSRFWDLVAGASAEIGVVFIALTLAVGSIWGKPIWGVWWTWDARLTSTAVLFVLYLGYLAVRRIPADPEVRGRRSAIVALAAFVDVPIVHLAVDWWRTLHQEASLLDQRRLGDPQITGTMLFTLLLALLAFTLLYFWLLVHRYRLAQVEEAAEARSLEEALAERRAEGAGVVEGAGVSSAGGAGGPVGPAGPVGVAEAAEAAEAARAGGGTGPGEGPLQVEVPSP